MGFAVVVPSKTATNLLACIAYIRPSESKAHIIVVDDGLAGYPVDVCVIQGEKPFCYAANCNLGISTAFMDPECTGVILLNDDALLMTPGGFSNLAQLSTEHPEVGILSATCNRVGNPNQKPDRFRLAFRYDPCVLAFVCVYIPRTTVEKLGMLDERFVAYGCEDCDYCKRVLDADLKLGITETCFVDHRSLPSSFRSSGNKPSLSRLGRQIYFEKHGVQP